MRNVINRQGCAGGFSFSPFLSLSPFPGARSATPSPPPPAPSAGGFETLSHNLVESRLFLETRERCQLCPSPAGHFEVQLHRGTWRFHLLGLGSLDQLDRFARAGGDTETQPMQRIRSTTVMSSGPSDRASIWQRS